MHPAPGKLLELYSEREAQEPRLHEVSVLFPLELDLLGTCWQRDLFLTKQLWPALWFVSKLFVRLCWNLVVLVSNPDSTLIRVATWFHNQPSMTERC